MTVPGDVACKSSQFWIASTSFFQTTLLLVPPAEMFVEYKEGKDLASLQCASSVELYDADGELVNNIRVSFPIERVGILELEPLLEVCKHEGGLKHGRAIVRSPSGSRHFCRMHSRDSAVFMGELLPLSTDRRVFFPLLLSENKSSLLILSNLADQPAPVKCKLIVGKRTPELQTELPPNGTRVLSVEAEFPEYSELNLSRAVQAYVRLSTRSDDLVGAQLLEHSEGEKETSIIVTVT